MICVSYDGCCSVRGTVPGWRLYVRRMALWRHALCRMPRAGRRSRRAGAWCARAIGGSFLPLLSLFTAAFP